MKVDSGNEQIKYGTGSAGQRVSQFHSEGTTRELRGTSRKVPLTIKGEVEIFCEETTAHGLGHAIRENSWFGWFWYIIFVAAFAGNAYHLSTIVQKYLSFPSEDKTTFSEASITFPYVTICNAQPMSISNKRALLDDESSSLAKYEKLLAENISQTASKYRTESTKYIALASSPPGYFQNLGEEAIKLGHQLKDFIVNCKLAGKACTEDDFNLYQSSSYFNCYTFHGQKQIYRSSMSAGVQDGLSLILYLENFQLDNDPLSYETYSTLGNAAGVRVVIHEPETMPSPTNDGFDIPPGFSTSIGMTVSKRERLGKPYGFCSHSTLIKNTTHKYTANSCTNKCLQDILVAECKCYLPDLPVTADHKKDNIGYCVTYRQDEPEAWFDGVDCVEYVRRNFSDNADIRLDCGCYSECQELFYEPVISQSYWPLEQYQVDFYHQYLLNKPEMNETKAYRLFKHLDEDYGNKSILSSDLVRKNFIRLNVYFRDLKIQTISQQPSYEMPNFWSDLGGTIGLWAGLSLITVIEVFVLTFRLILVMCGRKK